MTLIFGINLSDRIYISADTRLTQKKGSEIAEVKDRIIKVTPYTEDVAAAFAGDAKMASFVTKKLIEIIKPGVDIRTLRKNIEKYLPPIVNEYWEKEDSGAEIAVIFGGLNRKANKKPLTPKQVYDLAMALNKVQPGAGMNLKPAMFRDIMRKEGETPRYPESPDSHVFSVQIFPPNGFVVQDAEWGEYLAYGAKGITKDTLDSSVTARVELSGGQAGQDNAMLTAVLGDVVERLKEPTIGNTFFNYVIHENTYGVLMGRIDRFNLDTKESEFISEVVNKEGTLHNRTSSGELEPLTMLHQYKDFGSLQL